MSRCSARRTRSSSPWCAGWSPTSRSASRSRPSRRSAPRTASRCRAGTSTCRHPSGRWRPSCSARSPPGRRPPRLAPRRSSVPPGRSSTAKARLSPWIISISSRGGPTSPFGMMNSEAPRCWLSLPGWAARGSSTTSRSRSERARVRWQSMLLTIDIGNTNTVLGVFDAEAIVEHWRIATVPDRTADEIAVVLHGLLAQSGAFKESDLHGISLCSTVPSVLHEMREMCRRYFADVPAVIVEPGVKTGVPIRMDNPKEVGSDRIMNSLAAVHLYGGPAIVVDFGTSTNFDAVSARGEFVGGALAPGIEISVDALSRRAAQLLKVELTRPPRVIGKNTVEALQSGIVYGFAGQVEGMARRMAAELAPEDPGAVTVIATGGLAPLVIDEVPIIDAHEPWLTLIGLRLVWDRNTGPAAPPGNRQEPPGQLSRN